MNHSEAKANLTVANAKYHYRPVGRAVTLLSLKQEVGGSNLGPVKLDTVLPTAHHRCDIPLKGTVLPVHNDTVTCQLVTRFGVIASVIKDLMRKISLSRERKVVTISPKIINLKGIKRKGEMFTRAFFICFFKG